MRFTIDVRTRIQALMAEVVVRREDGRMAARFRVVARADWFTVTDLDGISVGQFERWDAASDLAILLGAQWVQQAIAAAPLG